MQMPMIPSPVLKISPAFYFSGVEVNLTALLHDFE